MNNKLIVQAMNTPKRYGNTKQNKAHHWAELILLYEDGTWEKIFEYRWNDPFDDKLFNTGRLRDITRAEAIAKLEKDYYSGKIKGVFMD